MSEYTVREISKIFNGHGSSGTELIDYVVYMLNNDLLNLSIHNEKCENFSRDYSDLSSGAETEEHILLKSFVLEFISDGDSISVEENTEVSCDWGRCDVMVNGVPAECGNFDTKRFLKAYGFEWFFEKGRLLRINEYDPDVFFIIPFQDSYRSVTIYEFTRTDNELPLHKEEYANIVKENF